MEAMRQILVRADGVIGVWPEVGSRNGASPTWSTRLARKVDGASGVS